MIPLDRAALTDPASSWQITVLDEVTSTSDWLKQRAAESPAGSVVFAESQTAGRGRRENRWIASRGKDLMFSMLLRPEAPLEQWPRITTLAALAVCKAIEAEFPLQPRIKWPNDIYLEGLKVSGLLAETVTTPDGMRMVLGIGLNVNTLDFPAELSATSLLKCLDVAVIRHINRNTLGQRMLESLHVELNRIEHDFSAAVAEVRERSWLLGKPMRASVDGHDIHGRALDLTEEGHLVIQMKDGSTATLASAENVRSIL